MRFMKWTLFFAVSFVAAWIIIFTFIQEPFQTLVPAKLLYYTTPPVPIYYYLAGSFVLGLGIGLGVAIYNFISLSMQLRKSRHAYTELSSYADTLKIKVAAKSEREATCQSAAATSTIVPVQPAPDMLEQNSADNNSGNENDPAATSIDSDSILE